MIGVLLLLLVAACLVLALGVAVVAWEALHPPRRTTAWALAKGTPPDPEPLARPWRFEMRPLQDGMRLPIWVVEGREPEGPVVLIVHGWGRSRWDSLRRAEPFLARASLVAMPDLRGHGEAGGRTTLGTREVDDMVQLAASLLSGLGPDPDRSDRASPRTPGDRRHDSPLGRACPIILVGHSMGAGIVIRAAAAMSPPPLGVIALAPYRRVVTPIAARLRLRALPAPILAAPAVLLLRAFGVREAPLAEALRRLAVPLLVISTEGDAISPASDARAIADAAAAAHLALLPGADHADPGAVAPDRFDRAIEAFLDLVAPISGSSRASAARG